MDIDGRLVDRRSLQELRQCAQDGRFGLVLGAAVARREHGRRSVWLPLTQVCCLLRFPCLRDATLWAAQTAQCWAPM